MIMILCTYVVLIGLGLSTGMLIIVKSNTDPQLIDQSPAEKDGVHYLANTYEHVFNLIHVLLAVLDVRKEILPSF